MESTEKNFYILHLMKGERVVKAFELLSEDLMEFKEYITDIYGNETGGITIVITIELLDDTEETLDVFDNI